MKNDFLRSGLAAGLALHLAAAQGFAATPVPAIGTVVTTGSFRLNHATVRSNATLFEGALLETAAASAHVDLSTGERMELEPESTVRVFGEHLVVDRGAARIARAANFRTRFLVEARGITIEPGAGATAARIALIGDRRAEVTALTGSFRILNSGGMLVAKIAPGKALALESQSTPGPARIIGRLIGQDGHYLLTDETTNVTVEVSGSDLTKSDLARSLGQRVEVTGSAHPGALPVNGAVPLIEVAQVTPAPSGSAPAGSGGTGGTAPAGAGGASGRAGGAAGGSAVSVTMIAIIGGVAAAAVVGGLAASGSLGGSTAAALSR